MIGGIEPRRWQADGGADIFFLSQWITRVLMVSTRNRNANVSDAQAAHLLKARAAALHSRRLKQRQRLATQLAALDAILSGGSSDEDTVNTKKKCSDAAVALRNCNRKHKAPDDTAREQEARDKATREQEARDKATREQEARDKATREQEARDKATREQEARDKAAREQEAREKAARKQEARDKATREQEASEKYRSAERMPTDLEKSLMSLMRQYKAYTHLTQPQ